MFTFAMALFAASHFPEPFPWWVWACLGLDMLAIGYKIAK